jgi:hypothetical protein
MDTTTILNILAANPDDYILDDIGTGEIVLKNADRSDMVIHDETGRQIVPRFPYALIEGLIQQHYVEQDKNDGRVYRISHAGIKAANS